MHKLMDGVRSDGFIQFRQDTPAPVVDDDEIIGKPDHLVFHEIFGCTANPQDPVPLELDIHLVVEQQFAHLITSLKQTIQNLCSILNAKKRKLFSFLTFLRGELTNGSGSAVRVVRCELILKFPKQTTPILAHSF